METERHFVRGVDNEAKMYDLDRPKLKIEI